MFKFWAKKPIDTRDAKIDQLRHELRKCAADFRAMVQMHASDYAARRIRELEKRLAEIDKL